MSDNAVEVVFGADTAGLQAGITKAKTGIEDMSSVLSKTAGEVSKTGAAINDNLGKSS